jgi:hypothetical protein
MLYQILFRNNSPIPPDDVSQAVSDFGESYARTVRTIIRNTGGPDIDKALFLKNCASLLTNFKMTRAGPFKGIRVAEPKDKVLDPKGKLEDAWDRIGKDLVSLKGVLSRAGLKPRSRTLLLLDEASRKDVIGELWIVFKKLLPVTMSSNSYGLVGASKILFSVFPEIALPIDNAEWRTVFRTVDFADVIHLMADEIAQWEKIKGRELQNCDKHGPTTLPSVYNVMAMTART